VALSIYVLKCFAQNERGSPTEEGKVLLQARMAETWYQLQPLDAVN